MQVQLQDEKKDWNGNETFGNYQTEMFLWNQTGLFFLITLLESSFFWALL